MTQPGQEFWRAWRDIAPLAIGVAIYGLAFGLLTAQASMDGLQVGVMGSLVFAGSSQIMAVERLTAGAGAVGALIAAIALNLRLLLITASVRDVFANRPWWQKLLGAHFATDENWALLLSRRAQGERVGYWYLVGGGVCLMLTWVVSTVSGWVFASAIPSPRALGMDFAFTAAFIAIARSLWTGRADLLPWLAAAGLVVLTTQTGLLDATWALVLGGIAGAAVAGLRASDDTSDTGGTSLPAGARAEPND